MKEMIDDKVDKLIEMKACKEGSTGLRLEEELRTGLFFKVLDKLDADSHFKKALALHLNRDMLSEVAAMTFIREDATAFTNLTPEQQLRNQKSKD